MDLLLTFLGAAWHLLEQSALYILLGLVIGGLLKVFLSADFVAAHLGRGRFAPVFKAALLGIPLPLCSCGVLPAAAQLRRQGANRGATAAFLVATPESGVDSIAVSWALLDPLLTVARPVAAFVSAVAAGVAQNLFFFREEKPRHPTVLPMATACQDGCCGGNAPAPTSWARLRAGARYAVNDIWGDLAGWFFVGLAVAAAITVFVPDDLISRHLGGGFSAMLFMLVAGVPMYICATASTPIAAALILKGVSPGAALVFLLAGPATNVTALAVIVRILGKGGAAVYLAGIAVVSVICGLVVDGLYLALGLSAAATLGEVAETLPEWLLLAATVVLLLLTLPALHRWTGRLVPAAG
jgi:uncharacterized membrane protein YraQ (UPF0718 family)